jgi:hypothetical protein
MGRVIGWIAAFGRFWYHFIIGDDWTIAAVVTGALVVTAFLHAGQVDAWWLMPPVVIAILGVSVYRARRV